MGNKEISPKDPFYTTWKDLEKRYNEYLAMIQEEKENIEEHEKIWNEKRIQENYEILKQIYFNSSYSKVIKGKKKDIFNEYGLKIEENKKKFNKWKEEVKKKNKEKFNQVINDINSGVLNYNEEDKFFKNSIEFIPKIEKIYQDKKKMNEMISNCKTVKEIVSLEPLMEIQNTSKSFYLEELKDLRILYDEQSISGLGEYVEMKTSLMEGINVKNEEIDAIEKDSNEKIYRIKNLNY